MTFKNTTQMMVTTSQSGERVVSTQRGEWTLFCEWLGFNQGHRWTKTRDSVTYDILTAAEAAKFLIDDPLPTETASRPRMSIIKKVCGFCGSDDIRADAWASWSVEDQVWEVDTVFDRAVCGTCGGATQAINKGADAPTKTEKPDLLVVLKELLQHTYPPVGSDPDTVTYLRGKHESAVAKTLEAIAAAEARA